MKTPITFLIYNRADNTRRVFEEIRRAKPPQLFVIADGPRENRASDVDRCEDARSVVEQVDWTCEVFTNFSPVNLGIRQRISSGLTWVFSQVNETIILEDDCVPHPHFFPFCEELLDRYRDDKRIMHIGGTNYQFGRVKFPYSYYFSRFNHCTGWASWKRAWSLFDISMNSWPEIRDRHLLRDLLSDTPQAVSYWEQSFQNVYEKKIDSWAYIWTLSCWIQNGLAILPSVNLISNIGFNSDGSHTLNRRSRYANMRVDSLVFPLNHPTYVIRDSMADAYTQQTRFRSGLLRKLARRLLKYYVSWRHAR